MHQCPWQWICSVHHRPPSGWSWSSLYSCKKQLNCWREHRLARVFHVGSHSIWELPHAKEVCLDTFPLSLSWISYIDILQSSPYCFADLLHNLPNSSCSQFVACRQGFVAHPRSQEMQGDCKPLGWCYGLWMRVPMLYVFMRASSWWKMVANIQKYSHCLSSPMARMGNTRVENSPGFWLKGRTYNRRRQEFF